MTKGKDKGGQRQKSPIHIKSGFVTIKRQGDTQVSKQKSPIHLTKAGLSLLNDKGAHL